MPSTSWSLTKAYGSKGFSSIKTQTIWTLSAHPQLLQVDVSLLDFVPTFTFVQQRHTFQRRREWVLSVSVIYVVQSPSALPDDYECIRDRVVLASWKKETKDTNVFCPGTTWTQGRNLAYRYAVSSGLEYDYAVFLDDDIKFTSMTHEEGFEAFERFLKDTRPPIGLPKCWDYNTKPTKIRSLPSEVNRQGLQDDERLYQIVDWFDACFNAIRKDVLVDARMFPYDARYDEQSWYASQLLLILRANLFHRNEIIQTNMIEIENKSLEANTGANYPKSLKIFGQVYQTFCQENSIKQVQMSRPVD